MHRRRKRLSPATIFGVIVLTIVLSGTFGYKIHVLNVQKSAYAAQVKELAKQQKALEKQQEELKEFKEYVKTDEYAEEVARDKFGLVYKGEIIFVPEDK